MWLVGKLLGCVANGVIRWRRLWVWLVGKLLGGEVNGVTR
ncbi:hypothetical protein A4R44_03173 [Amycolatopsis sp. M39]|nr:hypothetical protein A4R44_03173 [Amycolatopsis sp. M39]